MLNNLKHKRKQNRLSGFDYSRDGYYFVTICAKDREEMFGQIENNEMILNENGKIVNKQLLWLEKQYSYIKLDQYAIMPNHVHGVIVIDSANVNARTCHVGTDSVGTGLDLSLQNRGDIKILSLSNIIGAFKTTSSKLIYINGLMEFAWQRSFYDHIIRNTESLENIRQYIYYNSVKWEQDRNNKNNCQIKNL